MDDKEKIINFFFHHILDFTHYNFFIKLYVTIILKVHKVAILSKYQVLSTTNKDRIFCSS